jgi:glucose/mannose-6-phosphate isomerase
MNLDDLALFHSTDPHNLLAHLNRLPEQIQSAWAQGQALTLPDDFKTATQVVFVGMGDSAVGGALAQALAAPESRRPIALINDYGLPAWVGPQTLVVGISYSGNTEETCAVCEAAGERGAKVLALTSGGQLAASADKYHGQVWSLGTQEVVHLTVGASFMLALAALVKTGAIGDKSAEVAEAVTALTAQQSRLRAESPVMHNPAKRMAGQFMERYPILFASDYLAPVAWHWANQINSLAKAVATWIPIPEADHHQLSGTLGPEALIRKCMALFLRSTHNHPRNQRRASLTREIYMTSGFNTDEVVATGQSPLAHMLTAWHYGDYVAYYLAMCYGVDPAAAPQVDYLKSQLA